MKTISALQLTGSASIPLPLPRPDKARPVRRGVFWPGESFGAYTNKWDLSGDFLNQAFVLPALAGNHGSRLL